MNPSTRRAVAQDLRAGFTVRAICRDRQLDKADVLAIKRAMRPGASEPTDDPLATARRELLRAGYDPEIVAANFGGTA